MPRMSVANLGLGKVKRSLPIGREPGSSHPGQIRPAQGVNFKRKVQAVIPILETMLFWFPWTPPAQ